MTLRSKLFVLCAVLLLGLPGAPATADVGSYPSTLYMAGPPSSLSSMSGSYTLIGNPHPAPTATLTGAGTAPASGTYRYVYTVESGGVETASLASNDVAPSSPAVAQNIKLTGLPTGVNVRIYRMTLSNPSNYLRVDGGTLTPNTNSEFTDTLASSATLLVKAENRVQTNQFPGTNPCTATTPCVGYFDLQPGVILGGSTNNDDVDPFPPAAPNKRGFVVDGDGSVHIPAGQWTFTTQVKSNNASGSPLATNGVAYLTVAMWKVDASGNAVGGRILDPTDNSVNLIRCGLACSPAQNPLQTVTITTNVGDVSLGKDEHLYVQFWRHQTTNYTAGGPLNRVVTLFMLDGVGRIQHPGAVADPTLPTQTAPADGASTSAWPQLSARFDDPVAGHTGTLEFQLCSDASCAGVLATASTASGIVNAATGSVTVPTQALGTYYWRVRAEDSNGGISAWSATRSFTYGAAAPTPPPPAPAAPVDTTAPSPSLVSPAAGATTASLPALSVGLENSETGTVEVRICTDAAPSGSACAGLATSGSTTVSAGATGVFAAPLGEGEYHWQVRAIDLAGNTSSWTATRSFTYDATPPNTPSLAAPADGIVVAASPTLSAHFESADGKGGTLELRVCKSAASAGSECADAAASVSAAVGASGESADFTPEGLDGTYHWQARASDAAGNRSSWTATRSFSVDLTAPAAPVLESPRDGHLSRDMPTLTARYEDADGGSIEIRVCADAECAIVRAGTLSAVASGASASFRPPLGYGDYWWQARAIDAAGNASSWTSARGLSFLPGSVGRGSDVPLVDVPAVSSPLLGLAVEPMRCVSNASLVVHVVLRDASQVTLTLVQKSKKRGAKWRAIAVRHVQVARGTRTLELPVRRLSRSLVYRLLVDAASGAGQESRSLAVRILDASKSAAGAASACTP